MRVLTLFAALALLPRPAAAQEVPLSIQNVRLTEQHTIECVLVNSASQPATAWSIQVRERLADGSTRPRLSQGTDAYQLDAFPMPERERALETKLIWPGQSYPYRLEGPFDTMPILVPVALVLMDGTAFGDPSALERIFARRAANRDAAEKVMAELRDVQRSYRGLDALYEADARIAKQEVGNTAVWHTAAQNLSISIKRATSGEQDPDAALSAIVQQVEREYQAARKHSTRRPEPPR